jgi:hypothetical protein
MALVGRFGEEGGKGRGRARRDSRGGTGSAGSDVGKKKGRGEGEADRRGPGVGVCEEKEKEAVGWAAAGWFGGPAGLAGPKGERVIFLFFLFFQTLFKTNFSFQIQPNPFKLFLKNSINFLEVTQATKSYAKSNNDAQSLVVSILIKLSLIF